MTTVGAVWIDVLPSMRNFAAQASAAARSAGKASGTAMGTTMATAAGTAVAAQTPRTITPKATAAARPAGTQAGKVMGQSMSTAAGAALGSTASKTVTPAAAKAGGQAGRAAAEATSRGISQHARSISTALSGAVVGAISTASSQGVKEAGAAWSAAGDSMASAGSSVALRVSAPIAAVGAVSLSAAGDFESGMNRVRAITDVTGRDFDRLETLARDLGSTTQFSAGEAANAMGFLGMAGLDVEEIYTALPGTLSLAAAGQLDLAEAADISTNVLAGMNMEVTELGHLNDVLAEASRSANTDVRQLGMGMKQVAPVASGFGFELEETTAALGMLADAGIQGEQGGTLLRSAMSQLVNPTKAAGEALDAMGVQVTNLDGSTRSLPDILRDFEAAGADATDMVSIFGTEAGPAMISLLNRGGTELETFAAELANAGGTADTMASIQMEGLNGAMTELRSATEGLWIAIGDTGLLQSATTQVERLTSWLQNMSQSDQDVLRLVAVMAGLAAAIGPVVWITGQLVRGIGGVVSGVSTVAGAMATAGGTVSSFATGFRNVNAAYADNASFATRLGAAIRSQIMLWNQQAAAQGRTTAGLILHNTWTRIVRVATLAWTGVQWALNAAMSANPVGLVVLAIVALVAIVVIAYKRSETFRGIIDGLWSSTKAFLAQLKPLVPVLLGVAKVALAIAFGPLIAAFLLLRVVALALWKVALKPAFEWIAAFWSSTLQPALAAFGTAAVSLWQDKLQPAFSAIRAFVVDKLAAAFSWLWGVLQPVFAAIGAAATWLWTNALQPAAAAIASFFASAGESTVLDLVVTALQAVGTAALWLWQNAISPAFTAIGFAARLLFVIVSTVLITPVVLLFRALGVVIGWLWTNVVSPYFQFIGALASWLWTNAVKPAFDLFMAGVRLLGAILGWLWTNVVSPVFGFIARAVAAWWSKTRANFTTAVSFVRSVLGAVFTWLRDRIIRPVFSFISQLISSWWSRVRSIFSTVVGFVRNTLATVFTWLRDRVINPVWSGIRSTISSVWNSGIKPIFTTLRNGVNQVKKSFELARDGIEKAWKELRSITRKPVKFIVDTVYNDGIRAVWNKVAGLVDMSTLPRVRMATGGIMPGYTPGKDVHRFFSPTGGLLDLSGGESVMRPEWTRVVGPGWVNTMNRLARTRGAAGVRQAMGFAQGGVIPHQRFAEGGLFGRLETFGSSLSGIFSGNPLRSAAKAVLDPLISQLRDRYTVGRWATAMGKVPRTMVDRLLDWLRDSVGSKLGGNGQAVVDAARKYIGTSGNPNKWTRAFGMNGLPWCAMFASEMIKEGKAQESYDNLRSAAVATFANSNLPSVTSASQAAPGALAVYRGGGPGGWQHINIYDGNGKTIGGNESNSVKVSSTYPSRAAKFLNPRALAKGGIWEQDSDFNAVGKEAGLTYLLRAADADMQLFDGGGQAPPGLTALLNRTGSPEPVLTEAQWRDMHTIARNSERRDGHEITVYGADEPRRTAKAISRELRDYEALHPVP